MYSKTIGAQFGHLPPPPRYMISPDYTYNMQKRKMSGRGRGGFPSRPMRGRGLDDGISLGSDMNGYGKISESVSNSVNHLIDNAPELFDNATKNGMQIAQAVEARNRARDLRLTAAGAITPEVRAAMRADEKLSRDVERLVIKNQRVADKKDSRAERVTSRVDGKTAIKQAKTDRRINRINK